MHLASTIETVAEDANGRRVFLKEGDDILSAQLGDGNERSRVTRLGLLLNEYKGRVFGEYRIVEAKQDARTKSRSWKLEPAPIPAAAPAPAPVVVPTTASAPSAPVSGGDSAKWLKRSAK